MQEKDQKIWSLTTDSEERMFLAHVRDQARICREQNYMTYTKFMDMRQRSLAVAYLEQVRAERYVFYGGYDEAERCVLLFYPDYWEEMDVKAPENVPICLIRAKKSPADSLFHRDYLGSLMGLGIQRECVGDILVTEEGAELLVLADMAEFILTYYEKAGRKRLRFSQEPLEHLHTAKEDSRTVRTSIASLRLDGVLAAAFGLSRSEAAAQIRKGLVYQNFRLCSKADHEVAAGDVLNIRGKGKAEITEIGGQSRKGRIFLEIRRFL